MRGGISLKCCLISALKGTLSIQFPGWETYPLTFIALKNSSSLKYLDRLCLCSQAQLVWGVQQPSACVGVLSLHLHGRVIVELSSVFIH